MWQYVVAVGVNKTLGMPLEIVCGANGSRHHGHLVYTKPHIRQNSSSVMIYIDFSQQTYIKSLLPLPPTAHPSHHPNTGFRRDAYINMKTGLYRQVWQPGLETHRVDMESWTKHQLGAL